MACSCPQTDVELAHAVLAADSDEFVVCDEAYANLLVSTFGAGSTVASRPKFVVSRGNPFMTSEAVPETVVRPGLTHGEE